MRRPLPLLPALAMIAAFAAPNAQAATDTDQLTVTATIQSGCALDGGSIDFGQYVAGQSRDLDAIGEIRYANCTGSLIITLDGGQSANVNQRRMSSGSSATLTYQLYRNVTRSAIWSSGANAHGVTIPSSAGAQSGSVPVYGRILGGQTSPSGTYSDTVNITMSF